jgi:hypothetical protein
VLAKLEFERESPSLVCTEPAKIPLERIFPARALTRIGSNVLESPHATSRDDHAETRRSNETLTVPKATILGVAEIVSEQLIDKINPKEQTEQQIPPKPPRQKKNEALSHKFLQGKLDHLNTEDRRHTEPVLQKFFNLFHDEESNYFKSTNVIEHQIPIGDAQPIRRPQYGTPNALREKMQRQVQNRLDKGIIRESKSPWSAPAILIPKKSPDGKQNIGFL